MSHYMRGGYEPEAVINFIMLLGWSASGGREVCSSIVAADVQFFHECQVLNMNDIVDSFDLSAVHKSGAIVSVDRLAWLNKQHLRAGLARMESSDGSSSVMHAKAERLLMDAYGPDLTQADAAAAISLVRSRLNVISDVVSESRFLFEEPDLKQPLQPKDADIVLQFVKALQAVTISISTPHELQPHKHSIAIRPDSVATATAAAIDAIRSATKLKPPQLFPPIRVALTVCIYNISFFSFFFSRCSNE